MGNHNKPSPFGAKGGGHIVSQHQVEVRQTSGPIPDPETLAAFQRVLPDAGERIFRMAEGEQKHRHKLDTREQAMRWGAVWIGQLFAFLLMLAGTCGGIYLITQGRPVSGFVTIVASLGAVAVAFIKGRSSSRRIEKQQPTKSG